MNLKIFDDLNVLLNNSSLTEKLELIDKLITLKRYEDAYFKLAIILEYINILFVSKILKIEIKNSNIITFCNIYLERDKILADKMIYINGEYNLVSEDISSINVDYVEFLAANIYDIYNYMITNYPIFL